MLLERKEAFLEHFVEALHQRIEVEKTDQKLLPDIEKDTREFLFSDT